MVYTFAIRLNFIDKCKTKNADSNIISYKL